MAHLDGGYVPRATLEAAQRERDALRVLCVEAMWCLRDRRVATIEADLIRRLEETLGG